MKPTVQKIIAKLAKEKENKVELSIIDDYNKRIDKANNDRKEASIHYQKLIGKMTSAATNLELALKEAEKVEKMSKDLGIESPINTTKVRTKLSEYRKIVNALDGLTIKGGNDI